MSLIRVEGSFAEIPNGRGREPLAIKGSNEGPSSTIIETSIPRCTKITDDGDTMRCIPFLLLFSNSDRVVNEEGLGVLDSFWTDGNRPEEGYGAVGTWRLLWRVSVCQMLPLHVLHYP